MRARPASYAAASQYTTRAAGTSRAREYDGRCGRFTYCES
ncbi:hypothetical protein EV643_109203 [Kribbella sp. VKM Ac-2527]|uniref:Uncharacterized protein n=1 Tax=Kribbella caucasensis TaxID=2512215 RepID=A0A4V3C9X2_9ACTN|nr:hypothetical protein EV643_109203 [Kribbella sp. VKM Ac-2527]